MPMNRRKFFAGVGGLAAAATLPATPMASTPAKALAPVAPSAVPEAPGLSSFVRKMQNAYTDAIRNVWMEPNDDVTRKRIVTHVAAVATECQACRDVTRFDIIADDRNNPVSVIENNGNRITVVYVPPGLIYPRQLDMEFHAARRDLVTGEHYPAHITFNDKGIDGDVSYGNVSI